MGWPAGVDEGVDGQIADEVARGAVASAGCGALFWHEITRGLTSEDAAIAVGASQAAGSRWFRERGGMPLFMVSPLRSGHLSFAEREEIAMLKGQGLGVREIARRLGRDPSTVSRAAAQCGNPGRKARLPGLGRAVESGTAGAASQDGETDHQ